MNRVAVCLALLCSQVCGVCLFGQLNADFQHDKAQKSNCSPVTIQFTNTSTGSPDRYEWTINGREFSILEHPIRTFVDTGRFEICLEVEDANAQIDKTCQFLSFFGSPQLQLSTADSILCQPGEVSFQLSSNVSLDRISWDFGDGQVEEEALNGRQNIDKRHLYNAPGAYSVVVSVVDENGCEKTVLKKSLVNFPPLIAPDFSFTSLSGCPHSKQLIFQAASFYAHCLYDWSFGDGKTARGQSVIHNYARFGQYDVRLRLTDTLTNCTYEVVKNNPLEYEDIKFDLQITESADCQERNIQFQPPDGLSYVRFEWNFDDGHTTATDTFPTHVYAQNGCFLPSFTFIASDGCITTVHAERCIQINGTHAIDIQQDGHWEGCAEDPGLQIDLVASSDLAGMAWEWQMAGFDTLKRADPSFRINEFGTYPLSLLATYLNGCTRLLPIDTAKLLPVELSFSADVLQGCVPLEVALELEVTSLDSILSYDWQIGSINLSGATPAITIPDTGTFDVQVTVQTLTGCTAQATRPNYISVGQPPTLDFWAVPLISCAEDSTKFFCTSDVPLDRWHWLFGDGLSASGPDPWHHYVDTGLFNVVLTAWHKGCSSTLTKDNYVTIYPPVAKAAYEVDCNNPLSVQFIDNSIGAQRWEWDFGDGHKSSLQHPQHRYRESGHYEVILTVWNDDHGCRDAVETAIVVTDEKAVFDLSRTQLCQGDTLHIINHSIYGESFQFRIPQGVEIIQNGLSDPRPVLRFVEPGLFRGFDLRQVDANGCISNFRLNKEVDVEGVRVDFSADPTGGCPGLEVHFRNESSATTGSPLDYTWTFGFRGHTSKKEHPSHIFNGEDSYNISLKAISDRGCKEEEVKEDMVNVNAPKAGFGSTLIDCEMNIVQFRSQSSGGAGLSYHWSFGDGRFSESSVPLHIFESEGKYEVCLTVTNPFNCADQFCDSIDVVNVQADFTADKTYKSCPNPPLVTRFEDLSYNGVAWEWDFGDQTAKSYLQNPSHTYSEVGIYTVCLTSWDKDGCSHTFCRDNYIQVDGPTGSFEVSQQEGCAPLDVSFVGQVSQVASLYWDFGDGAGIRNAGIINQDSVQYTYANPGFYIPVLVLEDTSGCRISRIGEMIEVRSLDFDFAASINSQCEGALSPIDFFVQMDTSGADYDFEWQFAGGTPASSTEANPQQISYSSPGIYDVILQVTENGECLTSLHKEGFVQIYPQLLPDIHIPAPNGCPPFAPDIQVDSSFFAQEAMQWEWDFGNGVKSSSPQPQPIYETPGTYVIQLHVTSSEACEAVYMDTIVVHSLPEIDAGISKEVCIGGLTYLDATVPNDDSNQIHWFPSDGLDCTDCARPLAGPAQPTTYFLQLTTPEGCQVLDSVDIRIRPYIQPTITVEPDTLICLGRSVKLEVTSDVPIFGYTWDRQDSTLSCHNCPSPVTSPKLSSQYIVSVTGEGGCVAIDSVYIQVVEKQRDLFASDPTICAGGSYQLRVPYEQQEWTAAPGLNCQTCQNPIVFPDSTTTYELTTWDENGCRIRDQIVVNVLSSDAIDAGPDGRICEGDRFQAQASFPGEAVWLYEGNVVAGNTATPWLELNEDSIFILQVTNDLCLLRDSLRVQVRPKPQLELADQIICLGDSIRLNALGNADEYQWFPVSGLEEWTTPDPLAYPRETTTYYLLASLDGCRADTMQVKVEVLPRPEINSVRQWPFISGEPLQLIMEADGPGDLTYNWYPPDGLSCTDCPDPIVKIDQPTIYLFEAIAENGCREQVAIQMEERKICTPDALVLPTAFSPNNDGKNDELFVRGFAEVEIFQLYNRWGEMVFQTTDGTAGWDGTHKGEPLNTDVFIYYIEAICPDTGGRLMKTGDVTLLR